MPSPTVNSVGGKGQVRSRYINSFSDVRIASVLSWITSDIEIYMYSSRGNFPLHRNGCLSCDQGLDLNDDAMREGATGALD